MTVMLSYDVQNALNQKADNWKVNSVAGDLQNLQGEVRDLKGTLNRLNNENSGLREVLMRLIDTLSQNMGDEVFNQLQSLRMLL